MNVFKDSEGKIYYRRDNSWLTTNFMNQYQEATNVPSDLVAIEKDFNAPCYIYLEPIGDFVANRNLIYKKNFYFYKKGHSQYEGLFSNTISDYHADKMIPCYDEQILDVLKDFNPLSFPKEKLEGFCDLSPENEFNLLLAKKEIMSFISNIGGGIDSENLHDLPEYFLNKIERNLSVTYFWDSKYHDKSFIKETKVSFWERVIEFSYMGTLYKVECQIFQREKNNYRIYIKSFNLC